MAPPLPAAVELYILILVKVIFEGIGVAFPIL
jgi:hypothetical protein